MTNHLKIGALALGLSLFALADAAQAIAINRCMSLVRDQAGRETLVNRCTQCMQVQVERRRPGSNIGTPSMRDFTLGPSSRQQLPFRGPGKTRVMRETPCPAAGQAPPKTAPQGLF